MYSIFYSIVFSDAGLHSLNLIHDTLLNFNMKLGKNPLWKDLKEGEWLEFRKQAEEHGDETIYYRPC